MDEHDDELDVPAVGTADHGEAHEIVAAITAGLERIASAMEAGLREVAQAIRRGAEAARGSRRAEL
jgi:hypothetical protein